MFTSPMVFFRATRLASIPAPARWAILIAVSVALAVFLTWARLPAALLVSAMVAGILIENGGANIQVPKIPMAFAQATIGCMIARVLNPDILHSFLKQWPLFIGLGLIVIVVACALGWVISKMRLLPETTAIWGLLPGAASAMMIMADDYGADGRLVAFMQYLRVILVAIFASLVARFWTHTAVPMTAPPVWFPPMHWEPVVETLGLIVAGVLLGRTSRIPAGILLVSMFLGVVLQASGVIQIELPRWLLAPSYFLLGWSVGLRFTRNILSAAMRALPQTILSILIMIGFCGMLAYALAQWMGIDPLTAYLATSPGGADSIAIIASSSQVDVGFVMALQTARFLMVLLIGPMLSRYAADRITAKLGQKAQ